MRVLVINEPFVEGFCRTQRWAARTRGRVLRAPDWLAYATAVLVREGHDARLYDFPARGWDKHRLAPLAREFRPHAAILDCTTPSVYSDLDCAALIRRAAPDCRIYMVGPHASAEPEDTLRAAGGMVDAVAIGEYDHTVRDLVQSGGEKLASVPGIAYLEGGQLRRTPPRPLIDDLDGLPFPAWDQINIWQYFDGGKLYPYISVISGRGCPFRCNFCLWPQVMHGTRYRLRSPQSVVDELEYDLKLFSGLRFGEFFFEDDTFTVDSARAATICEEILRRGLRITWSVNSRATLDDGELMRLMKRAGCRELLVGFESGDPAMLRRMNKKLKLPQARRFMELAHAAGLDVHGCFVLGYPGETEQSMQRTVEFALSLGLHTVQFSAAAPFPGTEFYEQCQRDGLLVARSWEDWLRDGEQAGVINLPGLDKQTVDHHVDAGLMRFYFRPSYMARFLRETRSASDLYRKLRGFYNYFRYMREAGQ